MIKIATRAQSHQEIKKDCGFVEFMKKVPKTNFFIVYKQIKFIFNPDRDEMFIANHSPSSD